MPPSGRASPQRPRHITASTHVLAARLERNTAERVTVGNTPLHMLHLCDVQCVAPLFASCVSLTTMTVHLKYLASSTALEMLLRAAATSPTLTHISVIGGVTSMEAAAMASGIAAFTWSDKVRGQGVPCTAAPSASSLPHTARRAPPTPEGRPLSSGQSKIQRGACRRRYPASHRAAASSPYACTLARTSGQRQRCATRERGVPARTTQRRLQAGGAMWQAPLPISPLAAPISHRALLASSQGFVPTPARVSPLSAHYMEGGVRLTLELHRLEEATAALLLDGLRRAHRIILTEVRLCVATTEARCAGRRLAHEATKAAAHHRQRRSLFFAPSVANAVVRRSCSPQARAEEHEGNAHRPWPLHTSKLRGSPRSGLRTSAPSPRPPPPRPPASARPSTPIKGGAGRAGLGGFRPLLSVEELGPCQHRARCDEQRLAPRFSGTDAALPRHYLSPPVQPHTPLPLSPASAAGANACMRAWRPALCASERAVLQTSKADAFCRRGRYATPLSAGVVVDALSRLASPRRRLAQAGRLYSPPRWVSRAQPLTTGAAPPSPPISKAPFCSTLQTASARSTSLPAELRLELRASSTSSWSSRASSPPPRPPHPLPWRAAEAVASVVARPHAAEDEGKKHDNHRTPRTPPDVASTLINRRGLCRLATSPSRQPHSPLFYPSGFCSPRYCLRRANDGVGDKATRCDIPLLQTPSHCSRFSCSCFVCRSRLPRSPVARRPAAPASLANAAVDRGAAAVRAPRPRSSSTPAAVAAAQSSRSPHKHDGAPAREGRDAGDATPTTHSAATSLNGITPPRRQSGDGRENDGTTAFHKGEASASSSSQRTSRSALSPSSAHRPPDTDRKEGDTARSRHSAAGTQMDWAVNRCQLSNLQVSHTQLPPPLSLLPPERQQQCLGEEAGYVVYPNSMAFLRARVTEINRHVVWHQIQSAKATEAHSRRLAELEEVFSDRVTEELTDMLMVLTDMEHGSRIEGRR
ncbi:hypothetical protein LSCM1_01897 [Leishmania martiniquensis]|uniref:Uncharacterized protein n=1 Tax=Leishmania martiniquensis TaxID=1580590 RepID=A0A836H4C6_9TRYP|nr:hypothetical protein LSCM1_01897 [Leishmania martiniquensis]